MTRLILQPKRKEKFDNGQVGQRSNSPDGLNVQTPIDCKKPELIDNFDVIKSFPIMKPTKFVAISIADA